MKRQGNATGRAAGTRQQREIRAVTQRMAGGTDLAASDNKTGAKSGHDHQGGKHIPPSPPKGTWRPPSPALSMPGMRGGTPQGSSASLASHLLTLALGSCVPVPAGRGVTEETRLEVEAGLEGAFGGVVLEEVCRWGGMEGLAPGGLAVEGEDFLNMETK